MIVGHGEDHLRGVALLHHDVSRASGGSRARPDRRSRSASRSRGRTGRRCRSSFPGTTACPRAGSARALTSLNAM